MISAVNNFIFVAQAPTLKYEYMKLGILSDIHEDLGSLQKAMSIFNEKKCDELVCLGDILGFDSAFYKKVKIRDASECISIIKTNFRYAVIGNHDLFAIKKLPSLQNGASFYPSDWYDLSISKRKELSSGKIWLYENEELEKPLTETEIDYLNSLPEFIITNIGNEAVLFSHSVYPDFTGSNFFRLHNHWELKPHFTFMQSNSATVGFSGHTHNSKPITATKESINEVKYGNFFLLSAIQQILCPCIAHGKSKSGIVVADIDNREIEAIDLNMKFNIKLFSFYEKKRKNNQL